jgi:hypothetical protein
MTTIESNRQESGSSNLPEVALADWLAAEREIDISRRPNV